MIKQALLTAFILLCLHAIYVAFHPKPSFGQYTQQENSIKAQHFIYGDSINSVIIGSSQANRLIMDSLPDMFNLTFAGKGIFDGLSVLSNYEKYPKNIFIEMNLVLREENKAFTSLINSPAQYYLRKFFPSLRDEYQPLALVSKPLMTSSLLKSKVKSNTEQESDFLNNPYEDKLFMQILNRHIDEMSVIPDTALLASCFNTLKERVKELEKNNVNIFFFEMPIDKNLCNLPEPSIIRETFYETFSPSKYEYIKMPDCEAFMTTDGIHLPENEALKYTRYFKSQSTRLLAKTHK